jgi:hypothetical protein
MKREQGGRGDSRGLDFDGESEHEKNRRIKSEQARLLRKELCHLRPAQRDDFELEAERLRRLKE